MAGHSFYHWLSDQPPILRHMASRDDEIGLFLPESRVYRLLIYSYHQTADTIERWHLQARANRSLHVLHHLVNERSIALELQARGIPAVFVNHNAFRDERLFDIRPDIQKRYNAVYNARMTRLKRHALARDVSSLLVIGGLCAPSDSQEYFDEVRTAMPHAHFTHADGNRWMSPEQVASALNSGRVGLCLSAREGPMYAATEYLLCGLPVVSTVSLGGREEWFEPGFTRIIPDDPGKIADAVQELISLKIPPLWVRQQTLRKVWDHRRRFLELGQNLYDTEHVGRDFARDWYAKFFNKMGYWREPQNVASFREHDRRVSSVQTRP